MRNYNLSKIKELFKKIGVFLDGHKKLYFMIVFFACVVVHIYVSTIGWDNKLLDQHGFRQTQTAISTFYTISDGFKINYITPVLGYPWSIPFEFPIFQWIVAGVTLFFHTPIDQTGRFVSLCFFYLLLLPLYRIIKTFHKEKEDVLLMIGLVMISPIYLFWSRTFMIESFALFLAMSYAFFSIKLIAERKAKYYLLVALFGIMAAIVKVTTFVVFLIPAIIYTSYFLVKESNNSIPSRQVAKKFTSFFLFIVAIPILAGLFWTNIADHEKLKNPLARDSMTSSSLTDWTFGTLSQRLDPLVWDRIFDNSGVVSGTFAGLTFGKFFIPYFLVFVILFLFLSRNYRREVLLLLAIFFIGPFVFTNLYFEHTYYFYANCFALSILFGYIILAFCKSDNLGVRNFGLFVAMPFFLFSMITQYLNFYYPSQRSQDFYLTKIADVVKNNSQKDDTILIYGFDWNPSIAYYSERKAIMDKENLRLESAKMREAISNNNIGIMVVGSGYPEGFIKERLSFFKLNNSPVYKDTNFVIFTRRKS